LSDDPKVAGFHPERVTGDPWATRLRPRNRPDIPKNAASIPLTSPETRWKISRLCLIRVAVDGPKTAIFHPGSGSRRQPEGRRLSPEGIAGDPAPMSLAGYPA
jgi:hypothetical protein